MVNLPDFAQVDCSNCLHRIKRPTPDMLYQANITFFVCNGCSTVDPILVYRRAAHRQGLTTGSLKRPKTRKWF